MSAAPDSLKSAILAHFAGDFRPFYNKHLQGMKPAGKELSALCPFHADKNPSFSFNPETGLWNCHAGCGGGDILDFYGKLHNLDPKNGGFPAICKGIAEGYGITSPTEAPKIKPRIVAEYNYTDEAGKLLFQVVRQEPKKFWQRRPDGKGGWVNDIKRVEHVLYNLPQVVKSPSVVVVEGEKDVETLRPFGLVATSNPMGAGKWKDSYSETLAGKDVVIIPDNDSPGVNHARQVALSILGKARSVKIVFLPGLPEKGDVSDFITAHPEGRDKAREDLARLINETPLLDTPQDVEAATKPALDIFQAREAKAVAAVPAQVNKVDAWKLARELFPVTPFPWQVLPLIIALSLKELARSIATSPTALPGAAFAVLASTLGRTVRIVTKEGWEEPLVFWCADIRPSGEGKTPAMRKLLGPLYAAQNEVDKAYKALKAEWEATKKDERGPEPQRPRGFFATDLTLEALRGEVATGHGGLVSIQDEISAWLSSQNQYKKGGNDRESWLALFDGHPARVLRVKEPVSIRGARVSLCGGIQPLVWARCFGGEDGLYKEDGTIYRLIVTFEPSQTFPLTAESWSKEKRKAWESILEHAMQWANRRTNGDEVEALDMVLSETAQGVFFEWRNAMFQEKLNLPPCLRGFLPKVVTYALRLCGILRLMEDFSEGREPSAILTPEDIQRGIDAACFYMAHAVNAMQTLSGETVNPPAAEDKARRLAEVLENMRNDVDRGFLAVAHILETYGKDCPEELAFTSSKALTPFLRNCGLSVPSDQNANGRRKQSCLKWTGEVENFILSKTKSASPQVRYNEENQCVEGAEIENFKSASPQISAEVTELRRSENQSPQVQQYENIGKSGLAEIADFVSVKNLFQADGYPGKVVEI